jgi:hypothetical protein
MQFCRCRLFPAHDSAKRAGGRRRATQLCFMQVAAGLTTRTLTQVTSRLAHVDQLFNRIDG